MNMVGNLGSFASANAFPILNSATGSAAAYFWAAAALNAIGIGCWLSMRLPESEMPVAAAAVGRPVQESR
jgi:ACS family glucarate transporter-like MFS transporter